MNDSRNVWGGTVCTLVHCEMTEERLLDIATLKQRAGFTAAAARATQHLCSDTFRRYAVTYGSLFSVLWIL